MHPLMTIDDALQRLLEAGGSDLVISGGTSPRIRKDGRLETLDANAAPLSPADTEKIVRDVLDTAQWTELTERRHVDFAFTWREHARIRGNAYFQRGSLAAAFRLLPLQIPTFEQLGLPEAIHKLLARRQGLILVTGPTGSGKSTTQAAMIDHLNRTRPYHIITIEDPVEYVHKHRSAIVDQRQVGEDTPSFELFIGATLWSIAIGIPAGIIGALKRNSTADVVVTAGAIVGVSIPAFWEAIVLIYLLAVLLPIFPPSGYVPFSENPLLNLRAMVLPTFVLGTHSGGLLARYVRSSLLEVMGQDYVRTARAKGFSEGAVIARHALKPGMIPVVTVLGLSWGGLLAGAFFIEIIFAIPGLGRMSVDAIFQKDYPVMQATLIVVSLNVLLVNLLVDMLYGFLDPRVRVRG